MLAFNHKPIIADDSEGMWRRVHLIPFTRQFKPEEREKNLDENLRAEASGILAWTVRGCLPWQKEGLREPRAVAHATNAYRQESDHIGEFVEDCCIEEPWATVLSGELWERYKLWSVDREDVALTRRSFTERLEKRGLRRDRAGHGGTRNWVGVRLPDITVPQSLADLGKMRPAGDVVTRGDAVSDNSLTKQAIEKVSESASPCVTVSPAGTNRQATQTLPLSDPESSSPKTLLTD